MHENSSLHDYLNVLRRRKWLVLEAVIIVPAVAIALSLLQTPKYQASAEVLLSRQNLAALLNNSTDQSLTGDPARLAQTQADLARVPEVARRAVSEAGLKNLTPVQFLGTSSVSAKSDADILVFTVTNRHPSVAEHLATLYAGAYIAYRDGARHGGPHPRAARGPRPDQGPGGSGRYEIGALRKPRRERAATGDDAGAPDLERLAGQARRRRDAHPAEAGSQRCARARARARARDRPRFPARGARHTRSHRGRSSRRLGLPILAQVPAPPRSRRNPGRLAMVDSPESIHAEPYRILKTNSWRARRLVKTVMVTSARRRRGQVDHGRQPRRRGRPRRTRRNPGRPRLPASESRHILPGGRPKGLADVVSGHATLGEALSPVFLEGKWARLKGRCTIQPGSNGGGRATGKLRFLPAGTLPPNPGEFIDSDALDTALADLAAGPISS